MIGMRDCQSYFRQTCRRECMGWMRPRVQEQAPQQWVEQCHHRNGATRCSRGGTRPWRSGPSSPLSRCGRRRWTTCTGGAEPWLLSGTRQRARLCWSPARLQTWLPSSLSARRRWLRRTQTSSGGEWELVAALQGSDFLLPPPLVWSCHTQTLIQVHEQEGRFLCGQNFLTHPTVH